MSETVHEMEADVPAHYGTSAMGILTAVSACRNILPLPSGKKDSGLWHLSLIPRWSSMVHGAAEFVEKTQKKSGRRIKHSRLWFVKKEGLSIKATNTRLNTESCCSERASGVSIKLHWF